MFGLLLTVALAGSGDVQQIVAFDLIPGKTAETIRLILKEALPLYRSNKPMLRFRAYREVESPVPLELVVVSSFRDMAGMDASNRALRASAEHRGTSVGEVYGRIAALSQSHTDAFVENDPSSSWGDLDAGALVVFVSLRVTPGAPNAYETLIREKLVPWERAAGIARASASGRYLVSDGWDFHRSIAITSLGDWQRYVTTRREQPWSPELDEMIVASRQLILRPVPELALR